jgi:hypothetical protein
MEALREIVGERIRGLWPPCFPDLSVCDFYLWGKLMRNVYRNDPRTVRGPREWNQECNTGYYRRRAAASVPEFPTPVPGMYRRGWTPLWALSLKSKWVRQNIVHRNQLRSSARAQKSVERSLRMHRLWRAKDMWQVPLKCYVRLQSKIWERMYSNRPPTQTFRGLPGWLEGILLGCIYGSSGTWDSCLQGICVVAKEGSRCKVRRWCKGM